MLIAGVLCLSAAAVSVAFGLCALWRPRTGDPAQPVLRVVAPVQLAAAVMFAAGGTVALAGPPLGAVVVLIICVAGAMGTLAAGSWQGARYAARRQTASGCGGGCGCAQSCH